MTLILSHQLQPPIVDNQDKEVISRRDTSYIKFPLPEENLVPLPERNKSKLYLNKPSNINSYIDYDPDNNQYILYEKVGKIDYKRPLAMSFKEFYEYENRVQRENYWMEKINENKGQKTTPFVGSIRLGEALDKVFGAEAINITPQGSAELIFGYNISRNDNPILSVRNRRVGAFTFKEKIQMNVTGSIGDKMELGLNYNTEATFDFENRTKLEYTGKEDEIIKKIEAGNISFPLPGTLINGSQSLFGIKTELQFGKLYITNVFSHQKGESSTINIQGGAQVREFKIDITDYDANRHFFLSQFFRNNYNEALKNLPYVNSGIRIEQIEVWVTNKTSNFTSDNRHVLAILDLGESYSPDGEQNFQGPVEFVRPVNQTNYPVSNDANALYSFITETNSGIRNFSEINNILKRYEQNNFVSGVHYEKIESARKLSPNEYTVNRELGYISLNTALRNDEILAVAYVYTYKGKTYKVGELTTDGIADPQTLVVKLIKGINLTPKLKNWKLMMKNVYSLNAYQINRDNFRLDILYRKDETGVPVNYIKEEGADPQFNNQILLKVLRLDNLDSRNEPNPDGIFDFIEGVTIYPENGRIVFPEVEPFGSDLRKKITGGDPTKNKIANKYVFEELYDSTQTKAKQIAEKNKFFIEGTYKSASSSEIQLNAMNIPQGSIKVTAGGIQLTENVDYTVDYILGRVKILNQGLLESGTPISISLENNALFNFQTKTLIGTHLDYKFSDNFIVGATLMNLTERPLTQKVNIGEEPISNTIIGLNTSYKTESNFLTYLIDKLPFIQTKEPSSVSIEAEVAGLLPGQAKAIGKGGVVYIDDFESSETPIDLKMMHKWKLASTPQEFPEGKLINDRAYGFNRALLAWYHVDPIFTRKTSQAPKHLRDEDINNNYVREVKETEIYKERQSGTGFDVPLTVLNLAYYPKERGPYNFDTKGITGISSGIDENGYLKNPQTRWAGIMRDLQTSTDFETSNIEYIEFWLMDPYFEDSVPLRGGDLYFNLGEISEDILRDSRKSFENGLPTSDSLYGLDKTVWGYVPKGPSLVNAFDNNPLTRKYQDVGLDGVRNDIENQFFNDYLTDLASIVDTNSLKFKKIKEDPSADNFRYYLDKFYDENQTDILGRYKYYNGVEGNSPTSEQTGGDVKASTTLPDAEDINLDNNLNENEAYFSYRVSLRKQDLQVGKNFIIDKVTGKNVDWYLFRIPISQWESKYGNIEDFKSIRFIRMYLKNFNDSVILRFAELRLIRSEWRKYREDLSEGSPSLTDEIEDGSFQISTVNIEKNAGKTPVNYILPPGISRVIDPSQPQLAELNEQSMVFKINNLRDGDAKAAYKNVELDLRKYKHLKMFVHAEAIPGIPLNDYDLAAFIRIGSDYKDNYYEIEVPLKLTPPGKYDNGSDSHRKIVWPEENEIVIDLDKLVDLKVERDEAMRKDPEMYNKLKIYQKYIGKNKIKVRGTPNLSNIRTIMIGVRNPGNTDNIYKNDGLPKSAEIWFNELRLTDINNKGGWGANTNMQLKLANLGFMSIAGRTIKPGFGSIEQKVDERRKEETNQFDLSTNLELGKFFPQKSNISIPLFFGFSKTIVNPEYFPGEPDRLLKEVVRNAETKSERNKILRLSQDVTQRRSINFTNVRLGKTFKKFNIVSPSNFSLTAAYSDVKSYNYKVERNDLIRYRLGLTYNYTTKAKPFEPFRKSKILNSQYFRLLKDFNFNYLPNRVTFRTEFDRYYNEIKLRNIFDDRIMKIDSTVSKDFTWNRYYDLQWDLTRALRLSFSAVNRARIDEPAGGYDLFRQGEKREWKDSVWQNILKGGRNTNYNHSWNLSYVVPINKIPAIDWINVSMQYSGTYEWSRGPVFNNSYSLGHYIRNSNSIQGSAQFSLNNFYNKINFIKKINQKYSNSLARRTNLNYKKVTFTKTTFLKAGRAKTIQHNLKTQKINVKVTDENGLEIKAKVEILNDKNIKITTENDYDKVNIEVIGEVPVGENPFVFMYDNVIRFMTGLKNFSFTISKNGSTNIFGYMPETNVFGINTHSFYGSPGLPFILGWQDSTFVKKAALNRWLTTDSSFNTPYQMNKSLNINLRGTFEPFRGFRIDLTALRNHTEGFSEYFRYNREKNFYSFSNKVLNGNFSISIITIGTAFEKMNEKNYYYSRYFEKFRENRRIIAARLYNKRTNNSSIGYVDMLTQLHENDYPSGYGPSSIDVIIPAFLSAYTGISPENITLETLPGIFSMMPNWRINIDGLTRLKFIEKVCKSVNISHSYQSTYNVGPYTNYVDLYFERDAMTYLRDLNNNFYPELFINTVSISEKISPLINIDVTWVNNLITRFEISKSRVLSISLSNSQLTENISNTLVFGSGYRFKDVVIKVNDKTYKSDLNLRFDLSIRDSRTFLRYINVDNIAEQTKVLSGQKIFTVNSTADYAVSPRFNVQLFFDHTFNKPHTSRSFVTADTNIGFNLRFTLQ